MIIGYALATVFAAALVGLLISVWFARKDIKAVLAPSFNIYSLIAIVAIIAFFVAFELMFVSPTSQLYFDENIYQGIALNILNHFNAVWCQYGTGYVKQCFINQVYHDPVEGSFYIAMAFAVFGIKLSTAYGLELFEGALFILGVFLASSVLLQRKDFAVLATAVFALMPELFIWARTQADFDLTFGMLAAFAVFFFLVFQRRSNLRTLAAFSFALLMAVFARNEGIMLIPLFAIAALTFGDAGIRKTFGKRLKAAVSAIDSNTGALLLLLVFVVLLIPQIYYLSLQFFSPSYGQPAGQGILSIANFKSNLTPNVRYFLGGFNTIGFFPAVFPEVTTILAIVGVLLFAFDERHKGRFGILLLAGLWFLAYWLFYTFFYAGSATYGVDVRFMLQTMPAISIFAGLGIMEIAFLLSDPKRSPKALFLGAQPHSVPANYEAKIRKRSYILAIVIFAALIAYPFTMLIHEITLTPQEMPQQSVIHTAVDFIYNNYQVIPSQCVVFTFTPDMFEEFNRSAAEIGYLNGNSSVMNITKLFPCEIFDYGYWCVVPPNYNTTCANILGEYNLKPLATQNSGSGYSPSNVTLYQIENYT